MLGLMDQAEKVAAQFNSAGITLPSRLARFLDDTSALEDSEPTAASKYRPKIVATRPPSVPPDWLWVRTREATPATLALAYLRERGSPTLSSVIAEGLSERLQALGRSLNPGSVFNALARMEGLSLRRDEAGAWSLLKPDDAPFLADEFVWGLPSSFQDFELSAIRREAIRQVLSQAGDGLMQMQIVEVLDEWKKKKVLAGVAISKDVVKADLDWLRSHDEIKKLTNTRRWIMNKPK